MPRPFGWHNAAQFGGALNDNVFRLLVVLFLITAEGAEAASRVSAQVGVVFVLPFLLFTPTAGRFADRFSKRTIILVVKSLEILSMALALMVFWLHVPWAAYAVVFLMSTQSALFGPTKYGIVPELVGDHRLSRANSLLVLFTYLAIILGTAGAPALDMLTDGNYPLGAAVLLLIAIAGWVAAWQIAVTPAQAGQGAVTPVFIGQIIRTLLQIRHDRRLMASVWAAAYFLFLGGYVQMNIIPFGMEQFGLSQQQSAYLFLPAALGIGLGAWWVGRISGSQIRLNLVPLGVMGAVFGALGMAWAAPVIWMAVGWMGLLGVSAGFFIVPLEAAIQQRSEASSRGQVLASKGFLAWCGVLAAAGLMHVMAEMLDWSPAQGFYAIALLTNALLVIAMWLLLLARR